MDQSVLVRYVFILHESDDTCEHYTVFRLCCCMSYFVAQFLTFYLSIYNIIFTRLTVITCMVWLYMDKIYILHIHFVYILWLNELYMLCSMYLFIPFHCYLCRTTALWKLMLLVYNKQHEINFILSYLPTPTISTPRAWPTTTWK